MFWNKGYTASYYAYIIDPITKRETERLEITGGSISRGSEGLRDAADLDVIGYIEGEKWVRVYLDAEQQGGSAHVPLFTGLTSSPERNINGVIEENTLQCYSVLKPAQDILLRRGYYVPALITGDIIIRQLLSVTPATLEVVGEPPALQKAIIAEDGETNLSMIDKVLQAINWRLRLKGDGTVQLIQKPLEAVAEFDPLLNDIVEPSISINRDWYSCPNVLRVVFEDNSAVARDDDPNSPLSTISRGREIWAEETDVNLNTGEGLSEYAKRRLKELQNYSMTASYDRRFNPDILVGDLVRSRYEKLNGLFKVESQSIDLGYAAKTSEEVTYEER